MVWFYLYIELPHYHCTSSFQSHFGLILSYWILDIQSRTTTAFNPTMVWFYPRSAAVTTSPLAAFNPILVWFYRFFPARPLRHLHPSFNPILVWFYRFFPARPLRHLHPSFNPILVWFYLLYAEYNCWYNSWLSIPFWSDFIMNSLYGSFYEKITFNPILVWFYLHDYIPSALVF